MSELDLEVRDSQLPYPHPNVEVILHNFLVGVQHISLGPEGEFVLLKFFTPQTVYTVKLNKEAAEQVSNDLRPSGIQIARTLLK